MGKKYERVPLKNIEIVTIDGVKRVKNKKTGEITRHSMYDGVVKKYSARNKRK